MLVLSRKVGEKIVISDNIFIELVEIRGDKVRLGIVAPIEVQVHREEVWCRMHDVEVPARYAKADKV